MKIKPTISKDTCEVCSECNASLTGSTGYGRDDKGNKVCYDCCAKEDLRYMRENGETCLYLSKENTGNWKVSNWPGSANFINVYVSKGEHNWRNVTRYDVWFDAVYSDGIREQWHGVNLGDNEILRCKALRSAPRLKRCETFGDGYRLVTDSQDIRETLRQVPKMPRGLARRDVQSLFVLTGEGEYLEVWAGRRAVPYNDVEYTQVLGNRN